MRKWLIAAGADRRPATPTVPDLEAEDLLVELRRLYVDEQLSMVEIGRRYERSADGSVALTDRARVVACPGDPSSRACLSTICWVPVPARRDLVGGALVSPLRPVVPRARISISSTAIIAALVLAVADPPR